MDLSHALSFSRYVERAFTADAGLREEVLAALDRPLAWPGAWGYTFGGDDEASLAVRLRRLRTRVFVHTMLRDLVGLAPLTEVCGAMTALADLALVEAVRVHAAALDAIHGAPLGAESGTRQELIVIELTGRPADRSEA